MRNSILVYLLSLTALLLIGANWHVRRALGSFPPAIPSAVEGVAASDHAAGTPKRTEQQPSSESTASRSPIAFDWAGIETSDYKEYVGNLLGIGFPEELMRAIIIADVNKLYFGREQALRPAPVPHDAALSERQTSYTPEQWDRVRQLRELQMEKQTILKQLLGVYVPRELLRGPRSRNYEAYEYALGLLPQEKRDAAQWIVENEIIADALNHDNYPKHADEVEAYRRSREERDAALRQILSQEEFDLYEMNTTSAGTELARKTVGMQPTDEEFRAMFKLTYNCWLACGGVYSRWRAVPVPPDQIAAAERELEVNLKETLGPDRYMDYRMAVSETGQRMRCLASRYDLPRETLAQAFEIQKELNDLTRPSSRSYAAVIPTGPPLGSAAALQARIAELEQQQQIALGPVAWDAWLNGRNLRVDLDP